MVTIKSTYGHQKLPNGSAAIACTTKTIYSTMLAGGRDLSCYFYKDLLGGFTTTGPL